MVRLDSPKTLNVKGLIGSKEVVVLVDNGTTHNFIARALVEELQLLLNETDGYGVISGTRASIRGTKICINVEVSLGTITIVQDFLPIFLSSADVISGVQWLVTDNSQNESY